MIASCDKLDKIKMTENFEDYHFTRTWFQDTAALTWQHIFSSFIPRRYLEIGSFEGASACFVIDSLTVKTDLEVHCIDTWDGGVEHVETEINMRDVEARFLSNVNLAKTHAKKSVIVNVYKGQSASKLCELLVAGYKGYFDFIYVDGSHQATDVVLDAVLGFQLLTVGGVMVFDDYLWMYSDNGVVDLTKSPKLAIDAFTSIYTNKLRIHPASISQIVVQKTSW